MLCPVKLENARVGLLDESYLVLKFGKNNHIVVTPALMQITSPEWHARVGIDFDTLDIMVHKTRVHFFRGYYETGIAGENYPETIVKIEVPGWGPADITRINYVNGGQYLYPIDMDREMGGLMHTAYNALLLQKKNRKSCMLPYITLISGSRQRVQKYPARPDPSY